MEAEACVSYSDMTSMDPYYSSSATQGREHQGNAFRTSQTGDSKAFSPAIWPHKGHAYGDKSRGPFQQEGIHQSLDASVGEGTFSKHHLFMQRSYCKTPSEEAKLHQGHNGALIHCYGEYDAMHNAPQKTRLLVCLFFYLVGFFGGLSILCRTHFYRFAQCPKPIRLHPPMGPPSQMWVQFVSIQNELWAADYHWTITVMSLTSGFYTTITSSHLMIELKLRLMR